MFTASDLDRVKRISILFDAGDGGGRIRQSKKERIIQV